MRTLAAMLSALVLSACGGSAADSTPEPADLADQLAATVKQNDRGSVLSGVKCVRREGATFRCVGTYKRSQAAAEEGMGGIDTRTFTAADWRVLRAPRQVTYEVDVDPADGSYVYSPVP